MKEKKKKKSVSPVLSLKKKEAIILDLPPLELTGEERASAEKESEVDFVRSALLGDKDQAPELIEDSGISAKRDGELEEVEKDHRSNLGCSCDGCRNLRPLFISTTTPREVEKSKIVTTRDIPKIDLRREREEKEVKK